MKEVKAYGPSRQVKRHANRKRGTSKRWPRPDQPGAKPRAGGNCRGYNRHRFHRLTTTRPHHLVVLNICARCGTARKPKR